VFRLIVSLFCDIQPLAIITASASVANVVLFPVPVVSVPFVFVKDNAFVNTITFEPFAISS